VGQSRGTGDGRPSDRRHKVTRILTVGHGRLEAASFAALVRGAGVEQLVDVRSVPKSRAHPHFWGERMASWVPDLAGARYDWRPALGGFRKARPDSPNVALRHPSFRGYADYMQTPDFVNALTELVRDAEHATLAVMCSETLWWRCHRRLIADALLMLHGVEVHHLMHDGKEPRHRLTPGVRRLSEDALQYDAESW